MGTCNCFDVKRLGTLYRGERQNVAKRSAALIRHCRQCPLLLAICCVSPFCHGLLLTLAAASRYYLIWTQPAHHVLFSYLRGLGSLSRSRKSKDLLRPIVLRAGSIHQMLPKVAASTVNKPASNRGCSLLVP